MNALSLDNFHVSSWLEPKSLNDGWKIVRSPNGGTILFKDRFWWMDDFMLGPGYDNTFSFIEKASGKILMTGLGLGCIPAYLVKHKDNLIEKITIIEIEKELIEYVGENLKKLSPKIEIIYSDALTYIPSEKFDFAWHDFTYCFPEKEMMDQVRNHYQDFCETQYFWNEK